MDPVMIADLLLVAASGVAAGWTLRGTVGRMIEIKAEPKAAIQVELIGVEYRIQPPKASLALKLAVRAKTAQEDPSLLLDTVYEWIDKAFGVKNSKLIRRRLDDPEDALDIEHIMQLMEAVIEESSANPSTSSSGSQP